MVLSQNTIRSIFQVLALTLPLAGATLTGCELAKTLPGECGGAGGQGGGASSASPAGDGCVELQGVKNCPLGNASLRVDQKGFLLLNDLSAADKDGVSIFLPKVSEFTPSGHVDSWKAPATLIATSVNEGVSTSVMTIKGSKEGDAISATFTGKGQGSTYTMNLYDAGALTVSVPNIPNGEVAGLRIEPAKQDGTYVYPRHILRPPVFRVMAAGSSAPGACVWTLDLADGLEHQVRLPNGKLVTTDRIELQEEVPGDGGYPYLTFDRIDYTTDGAMIVLSDESHK